MQEFKLNGMPYTNKIRVLIGSAKEVHEYVKDDLIIDVGDGILANHGLSFSAKPYGRDDEYHYIWVTKANTAYWHSVLIHELLHITAFILKDRDIPFDHAEEAYTYLLGHLVEQINRKLKIKFK